LQGQRVGYVRVGTVDQNPDQQLENIQVEKTFIEKRLDTHRPVLQHVKLVTLVTQQKGKS
jgi:hypothetical protein